MFTRQVERTLLCSLAGVFLVGILVDITIGDPANIETLAHDIDLPDWGPYSDRYAGLSHISDRDLGMRFDLSIFPLDEEALLARDNSGEPQIPRTTKQAPPQPVTAENAKEFTDWSQVKNTSQSKEHSKTKQKPQRLPGAATSTGYVDWQASPGLEYYCQRFVLDDKRQVLADVHWIALDENRRLIGVHITNATVSPRRIRLHALAHMRFAPKPYDTRGANRGRNGAGPLHPAILKLPTKALWIDAHTHSKLTYATPPMDIAASVNGLRAGELRDHGFVDATALGDPFGKSGDKVEYFFEIGQPFNNAVLLVRARVPAINNKVIVRIEGITRQDLVLLPKNTSAWYVAKVGAMGTGQKTLTLTCKEGRDWALDGFVVVEAKDRHQVLIHERTWNPKPKIETANGQILNYRDSPVNYGLRLPGSEIGIPKGMLFDDLDSHFNQTTHPSVRINFTGVQEKRGKFIRRSEPDPEAWFVHIPGELITLHGNSEAWRWGLVGAGDKSKTRQWLADFDSSNPLWPEKLKESIGKTNTFECTPEGEKYRLAMQLLSTLVQTNIFYPMWIQGRYVKGVVPAHRYTQPFTWDVGCMGLALHSINPERARQYLAQYCCSPQESGAYLRGGSPVLIKQFYQGAQLLSDDVDYKVLTYFYPRLRQMYEWLVGRYPGSVCGRWKSGLLSTWDYFYNIGWDDYPAYAVSRLDKHGGQKRVTPVVHTAYAIRGAKILRQLAMRLNYHNDIPTYNNDIERLAAGLQKYSWDNETGYYGYVLHDEQNHPISILRTKEGVNANMGMGGVMPLITGVVKKDQRVAMLNNLKNPKALWTPMGLTTIDQRSPLFRMGYWNGAVWVPYQWIFWKAMLDYGETSFAKWIVERLMENCYLSAKTRWRTYERIGLDEKPETSHGVKGFAGLSAPALDCYLAYYQPGRVTTGYDVYMSQRTYDPANRALSVRLKPDYSDDRSGEKFTVLVTMHPGEYVVAWKGQTVDTIPQTDGCMALELLCEDSEGVLSVRAVQ